jgi:thioredoxin reductase (NADPH)
MSRPAAALNTLSAQKRGASGGNVSENGTRKVIIIGGGPAGFTSALYTARANLEPLVIEGFQWGGQLMNTSDVENYPGYPDGILGPEMMKEFRSQAARFGAEFVTDDVVRVDFSQRPFVVATEDEEYRAETIIVATGATARELGFPTERQFQGRGVSYCAVCDAPFFRDRPVVVVGGGDSAFEEATYIAKFASKVYLVHRRDEFRASQIMVDRARATDNLEFILNAEVAAVAGEPAVQTVTLRSTQTGEEWDVEARGLFVAIGHDPTTKLFKEWLDHDDAGYLVTQPGSTRTNIPGVFAAGDVQDHTYRQAVTAAGSGCMAALDAERFLAAQGQPEPAAV